MASVVVLEINEVPLSLLQWYVDKNPGGALASVFIEGRTAVTEATDTGIRELYPSQTWATLAMGVPYEKHGVYWYGDPKPDGYPLYWQIAAEHRRVGIVNTLHSSPFADQCTAPGLAFAVPDVFATTPEVRPSSLEPLQTFSQMMTNKNARAVRSSFPALDYLKGLNSVRGIGVQPATLSQLGLLAGGVASGRVPKERLRTAQFLLMADVFLAQLDDQRPDLAVFFTNHVAAAMHRYWPASFPEQWDEPPRSQDWIDRFAGEIPFALAALDRFVGRVKRWSNEHDRTVVLVSSMGQIGGEEGDADTDRSLVVDDAQAFASAVGLDPMVQVHSAMVPHITFHLDSEDQADLEARRLASLRLDAGSLIIDRSGVAVTITYHLDDISGDEIIIDGVARSLAAAGLQWVAVEEQKAGVHHPHGSLIIDRPGDPLPATPIDTLEVAPAILQALGIEPMAYHQTPSFSI